MMKKLFVSLLVFTLFTFTFVSSQTLTLPDYEIESAKFIIRQYGLNIPETQQGICGGASTNNTFKCTNSTNGYHITEIDVKDNTYWGNYSYPDPNFTLLNFPELIKLTITQSKMKNTTFPTLTLIGNLTNLQFLRIYYDITITIIPNGFPNPQQYPYLKSLDLWFAGYPIDYSPIFNSQSILERLCLTCMSLNVTFDDNLPVMPNLKYFQMFTRNYIISPIITISDKPFPNLQTFNATIFNSEITIHHNHPKCSTLWFGGEYLVGMHFITSYPSVIERVNFYGNFTFTPQLSSYSNLVYAYIADLNTPYPFPNGYPTTLQTLMLPYHINRTAIPNIPLPPSLTTFGIYDSIVGTVPWNLFSSQKKLSLNLSNNKKITGSVADSMCSVDLSLNILNTNITALPNCLNCYILDTNIIKTGLTAPPTFQCGYSISTPKIVTVKGVGKIVGQNLGWGIKNTTDYSISRIVPNSVLEIRLNSLSGPGSNYAITLNDKYSYSIQVFAVEVGIEVSNGQLTLIDGGAQLNISFTYFNPSINHTVLLSNGTIPCIVTSQQATYLICQTYHYIPWDSEIIYISNQNYTINTTITLSSPSYPSISAIELTDDNRNISVYGYFGLMDQLNASISINNTLTCNITYSSTKLMNCVLDQMPSLGLASINVSLDGLTFFADSLLYFTTNSSSTPPPPSLQPSTKEQCEESTLKCHGHGQCLDNGQCQCNPGYNQNDNCLTKYVNTTFENTLIEPMIKFNLTNTDSDGIIQESYGSFILQLDSIQELNFDNTIVKELQLSPLSQQWTKQPSNDSNIVIYQLQVDGIVLVANITFSPIENTDTDYLGTTIKLDPSSIKFAFAIENWNYGSHMSTLQVNYRSNIQSDQSSVQSNCDKVDIKLTKSDVFGVSIEYLQIVNDQAQFNGRFIGDVESDGVVTYSRNLVVDSSSSSSSSSSSIKTIYLSTKLPHCRQECKSIFDFTPLAIEKGSGCSSSTKTSIGWKAGVGVAVPMAAILAAGIFAGRNKLKTKFGTAKSIVMKRFN